MRLSANSRRGGDVKRSRRYYLRCKSLALVNGRMMQGQTKQLGQMVVSQDATPEELVALKKILEEAGLIVEAKGRELLILVRD